MSKGHVSAWLYTLIWVLCVAIPSQPIRAQDSQETTTTLYTFAFVRVPLSDALEVVMRETSIDLIFDNALVEGKTSFCSINRKPQEDVLRCLVDGTGLDFVRLSSGTYVLIQEAQTEAQYGQVSGTVADARTGLPLRRANVFLLGSDQGVATSKTGYFVFPKLEVGEHQVIVTHVAYEDTMATIVVGPKINVALNMNLRQRIFQSRPVIVSGLNRRLPDSELARSERSNASIQETPGAAVDLTRSLSTISGVQVNDALSTIHIQGGDAGEHEFRLDGVPVFMPLRNGGFVGPFSPFAIDRVNVSKAGFDVTHGSVISGVIDATHDVSDERFRSILRLGPLSMNARLGGRQDIGRARIHWMAAARRSLWSIVRNRQLNERFKSWSTPSAFVIDSINPDTTVGQQLASLFGDGSVELKFSDIHGAVRIQSGLQQLYVSVYSGYNVFGNEALEVDQSLTGAIKDEYEWHNLGAVVEYDRVLTSRVLGQLRLWKSSYRLKHPFAQSPFEAPSLPSTSQDEFNEIETLGGRGEVQIAASNRQNIVSEFEVAFVDDDFRLSVDPTGSIPAATPNDLNTAHWRWAASVQDEVSIRYHTTLTVGSRFTYLPLHETVYLEPRLSIRRDIDLGAERMVAVQLATGLYRHFLNQFDVAPYSVSAILPSFRFWIPLTEDVRPPSAIHFSSEILFWKGESWALSSEFYHKMHLHMNVLNYSSPADEERSFFASATGQTTGANLTLSASVRRFTSSIAYVVNRSTIKTEGRFNDRSLVTPWNAPHQVKIGGDYRARRVSINARVSSIWGRTWGYQLGYYNYLEPIKTPGGSPDVDFSSPENDKLPMFLQLDAGIAYRVKIATADLDFRVSALNVFGRKNTVDWLMVYDDFSETYVREDRFSIPFTPLASITISI